MDGFIEELYQGKSEKKDVLAFMQEAFGSAASDKFVTLRDSSQNTLFHHVCLLFGNEEATQFLSCIRYLFSGLSQEAQVIFRA